MVDSSIDDIQVQPPVSQPRTAAGAVSFWRRFWAFHVDLLILGFVVTLLSLLGVIVSLFDRSGWLSIVLTVIMVAIPVVYYVVPYSTSGQTPGKALLRIRVASIDGSPLSWRKGVLRTLGYIPSELFLLGFLWSIWDPDKQTWHDKVAGTTVVPASVQPEDLRGAVDPAEARQRERRWQVRLGIPTVVFLVASGVGFVLLVQNATAEVRQMGPWPAADASPAVVGAPDLTSLGLTVARNRDVRASGECFDGSYVNGASIVYATGETELVNICALRYADAETAEGEFAALASYTQQACGQSAWANWGGAGVASCGHANGLDRILWSDNWILLISARNGSDIPASDLVDRTRDALSAYWKGLRKSS